MLWTVDRFEGGYVMCESPDRKIEHFKRELFPDKVKEGDLVRQEGETFTIDREAGEKRRKSIQEKFNRLKK